MSLATLVFVALAVLFVSGVIGRTIHNVRSTADRLVGRCRLRHFRDPYHRQPPHAPTGKILEALGMQPGQIIFAADLARSARPHPALDWIASAEMVRRYPDAIFVTAGRKASLRAVAIAADAMAMRPLWSNARAR